MTFFDLDCQVLNIINNTNLLKIISWFLFCVVYIRIMTLNFSMFFHNLEFRVSVTVQYWSWNIAIICAHVQVLYFSHSHCYTRVNASTLCVWCVGVTGHCMSFNVTEHTRFESSVFRLHNIVSWWRSTSLLSAPSPPDVWCCRSPLCAVWPVCSTSSYRLRGHTHVYVRTLATIKM